MARCLVRIIMLASSIAVLIFLLMNFNVYHQMKGQAFSELWPLAFSNSFRHLDIASFDNSTARSHVYQVQGNGQSTQGTSMSGMSKFRQNFLLWDRVRPDITNNIGPDVSQADKYFIYKCDLATNTLCGGLGDRIKGMLAAYVIANLTGRAFRIQMSNGACDFSLYLSPNLVNWTFLESFDPSLPTVKSDSRNINMVDSVQFHKNISTLNFTNFVAYQRYVYFQANLDYSKGFQESILYRKQLSWMKELTPNEIQATLFKRLFKLAPRLQTKLQNILTQELPSPDHKLVCAHVRMGRNPTIPHDSEVRLTLDNLPEVWTFIANQSTTASHKIFLMTDCELAIEQAKLQDFRDRLISTPGVIKHIERSKNMSQEEQCDATEKVLIDFHLLMNCDVLMISTSGLSRLAAYLRGSDFGLYCLSRKGKISPCERRNLKDIYNKMG